MVTIGSVECYDDLRICAPPYARLTPSEALDLAEYLNRTAFLRMLVEELDLDEREQAQNN